MPGRSVGSWPVGTNKWRDLRQLAVGTPHALCGRVMDMDLAARNAFARPGRCFPATEWSDVLEARDAGDLDRRRRAIGRLIATYWVPVHAAIRRRGFDTEAAKDLTQSFFTAFMERDFLRYVDPPRGTFRIFLLTTLEHHLADERDRMRAAKRGGGRPHLALDAHDLEPTAALTYEGEDPERQLCRRRAVALMSRAVEDVRASYRQEGRGGEFDALAPRLIAGARTLPTYAEQAAQLGLSEHDVNNRLHRLRRHLRRAIWKQLLTLARDQSRAEERAHEALGELFSAVVS